jgi:Na+-transporting NADH:ubiquinone oxidoreductase subunit C
MQQGSNRYIIFFAAAVCLVCSVFVAFAAVTLKERQERNAVLDRQKKVLIVSGLMEEGEEVSPEQVQKMFDESIVSRIVELDSGTYAESIDNETYDQQKALKDPQLSEKAPENKAGIARIPKYGRVYYLTEGEEIKKLILPVEGKGLWSTLYGYLALAPDTTTITGITFYQHGETPGLGGEVDNPSWKALWPGRQVYDDSWEPAIEVIKGAAGPPSKNPHKVDGLSGATLTSRGVTELLHFWLGEHGFGPYLENFRSEGRTA